MRTMTVVAPIAETPGHLARLNPAQREAVLHGDGPLLVIAGAGTGKTNTLVHRLAQLVLGGADPRRILLMTFSRRAAAEMTRRAESIAGEVMGAARGGAGAGARLGRDLPCRRRADPAGICRGGRDRAWASPSTTGRILADLMNLVRHRAGFSATEKRFPGKGTCIAIYSRVVNAQAEIGEVLRRHFPWCTDWEAELRQLFAGYVAEKQAHAVLDYDDLLLYWAGMMQDAALAGEVGGRFDHVLVDEYQDTNRLQAAILLGLKPDGKGVTVVGDDAQSIYSFRAAEVRNILDFPGLFAPPARVVALEENYRSTPQILEAANAVIAEAEAGFAKRLRSERPAGSRPALVQVRDEAGQVDFLCRAILEAREAGTALKEQAVLFRTAHHSGALEVELVRRNIPFVKYGGLKFLDSAHVKDVMACLQAGAEPGGPGGGVPGAAAGAGGRAGDGGGGARRDGGGAPSRRGRSTSRCRARRRTAGRPSPGSMGCCGRGTPAGPGSWRQSGGGMTRTWSGSTTGRRCGGRISPSSRRSRRGSRAASGS